MVFGLGKDSKDGAKHQSDGESKRAYIMMSYDVIIDKFGDFSCDIDYNSKTDVFRVVIYFI